MKKREQKMLLAAALVLAVLCLSSATSALTLTEPKLGVANQSTFNITVTSSGATSCKYSSPFEKPFAEMAAFTETGAASHRLLNYNPQVSSTFKFFVECSNAEKGNFDLLVDANPPAIVRAVSVPSDVIETPFQAKLVVETNKNSTCKYGPDLGYDAMTAFFRGSDDTTKDNYENYHEVLVTGLADKTYYTYNISCLSLSHMVSSTSKITFRVDTSVAPVIMKIMPSSGFAAMPKEVNLSVTTNKKSVCAYGNTTEYKESGGNFSLTSVNHQVSLQFEPGKYKYYVKCLFEGPREATSETSFSVDSTPPANMAVNDSQELSDIEPGYTYRADQLLIRFSAEDNESGVDFYNFSIIEDSSGKIVYGWSSTTDSKVTVSNLKLRDGEKYYVYAYAQNKAGMRSLTVRSSGVVVNILLNSAYACSDSVKDGDEADADCGGSCPTKCATGKSCFVQSDCKSAYCVDGTCKAGICTDSFRNQDETGIDCGGVCSKKCDVGSGCRKSSDCDTGICTGSICIAEGPCSNKKLDPGETDVDCGGLCASSKAKKCLLGKKCIENSDCSTGLCNNAGKCASLTDRDSDGILNDADLCPEVPSTSPGKKQADADGDKTGDECDLDNDNDGMPDDFEKKYGFNALNSSDSLADPDKDGLSSLDEFKLGTSPKLADTDKDGASDGTEVAKGSNPKDPKSKPKGNFAFKATIFLLIIAAFLGGAALLASRKNSGGGGGASKPAKPHHAQPEAPAHHQQPLQHQPRHSSPEEPEYRQHHYKSRHDVFDELQKTYSQMSGEELFDHLKRKTGRK